MQELKALKQVYKDRRYLFITLAVALVVFSFMAVVTNLPLLWSSLWSNPLPTTLALLGALVVGVTFGTTMYTIIIQAIITILIGISVALVLYKGSTLTSVENLEGMSATLFAVFSTGCSACGVGALSMLGIAGGLAVLPFNGVELWVGAILLLLFSIRRTSKAILNPNCSLNS